MLFVRMGEEASDSLYSCKSPTPPRAGTAAACTSTLLIRALRRSIEKRATAAAMPLRRWQLAMCLRQCVPLNIAGARKSVTSHVADSSRLGRASTNT